MAIKKTELYSSLWQSCDELRGGMDASQYKDYILTLLFMKYVSDRYGGKAFAVISVPQGGSFADIVQLKGDKNIGEEINKIIRRLAEENDLRSVIDLADFNDPEKLGSGKEMVDRLSQLVAIFEGLDLSANRAGGDDLLGDAYEYLMRNFATESGKSKGQFYTPAEVSRVMAKVVGVNARTRQDETVYDPTCGSGSLLLKVADEAPNGMSIYGQEMDNATWALARMNMFLHNYPTHEIAKGNTLASPQFTEPDGSLKRFDFAVANPPFSYKAWRNGVNPNDDPYGRFAYGIPPNKNGDYAFLLHILKSLKSTGKAAVILPHGVLFRGNTEADIRRELLRRGYIKGIIGLPPNLFYGTGIPAAIIVLDKAQAATRTGVFMVDASRGFMKDGAKNRLRSRDIHKIVDTFTRQTEEPGYARLVPLSEIKDNDYNLNIPRYIDGSDGEDRHDLGAHLHGGIPQADVDALQPYWDVLPRLRAALFAANGRDGYLDARVPPAQVKDAIQAHQQYRDFARHTLQRFHDWRGAHEAALCGLGAADDPKALIERLSDDLLARFDGAPLVDRYAVYQVLMDYWAESMQDDVYLIVQDGWETGAQLRELLAKKGSRNGETPDFKIGRKKYKADLVPHELLIARFFGEQQAAIERLQAEQERLSQEFEALLEEHGGEDGLLEEAKSDAGNVTKGALNARLKELQRDKTPPDDEELQLLQRCRQLYDDEATAKKAVQEAEKKLLQKLFARYPRLTVGEIKTLVVHDKWFATLAAAVEAEIERVTQHLATRVRNLEERYAAPLPEIVEEVGTLSAKVEAHLQKMGVS